MGAGDPLCVPEDVHTITAQSAADYSIPLGADGQGWGSSAARQALLACGCSPEVVTEQWVRNHFRWSVWSCASYARRFPAQWREFWSIENITSRLLYRYEREFVRGERSALKKILEADASPQQLMVLCVAAVFQKDGVTRAEVTDGWYSMASLVDPILAQAIARGRLRVGDKIACCGL
ncbi:nucleic acid-binding protein, partial [Martensiomyces pterosporus]